MNLTDEQLIEAFQTHAANMELKAVDFIDTAGQLSKRYTAIRCTFVDGRWFIIPRRLERYFNQQTFKLRPVRDNA